MHRHASWRCALFAFLLSWVAVVAARAGMFRLSGTATVSPVCGGPQLEDKVCSAPLTHVVIQLSDPRGNAVARTTTDDAGRFDLSAPAGSYKMHALTPKLPRCPVLSIVLPQVLEAHITLDCDSGMR